MARPKGSSLSARAVRLGNVTVEGTHVQRHPAAVSQVHRDAVTDGGEPAEPVHDQAGHGVVVVLFRQLDAGGLGHLVQAAPGVHQPALAVGHGRLRDGVVLVGDVTDEFPGDVLVGDDAGDTAVFVQDDGELVALSAHLLHRVGQGERVREQQGPPGHRSDARTGEPVRGKSPQLPYAEDAGDVVRVVAEDRVVGVAVLADEIDRLGG
ncbi:hypothetical protein AQI88_16280 [Streptomyces cellostaticus]|uniref:Uncharacterized protein n=1 Tax=Streptomyces cellostaticus TaxID=67285 RepID=A0A101NLY5_9ACTN|nr:hypothetical protein AQI88_16280 [Streptomyces cellostaticus]